MGIRIFQNIYPNQRFIFINMSDSEIDIILKELKGFDIQYFKASIFLSTLKNNLAKKKRSIGTINTGFNTEDISEAFKKLNLYGDLEIGR